MTNCGHFVTFGAAHRTCEQCGASLNRFRVYVGPTLVGVVAARVRAAGFNVDVEGTEHVYFSGFDATPETALAAVNDRVGSWTLRDVQVLP